MNGVRRKAMTNGLTEDIVKLSLSHIIFVNVLLVLLYGTSEKKEKKM